MIPRKIWKKKVDVKTYKNPFTLSSKQNIRMNGIRKNVIPKAVSMVYFILKQK